MQHCLEEKLNMWAAGARDVVSRGQVEGLGASRNAHGRDVSPAKQTDRSRESVFSSGRKVSTSGSNHEVIAIYQQLYRLPPDILRPFFFCLFFLLLLERLQKISLANPVRQD